MHVNRDKDPRSFINTEKIKRVIPLEWTSTKGLVNNVAIEHSIIWNCTNEIGYTVRIILYNTSSPICSVYDIDLTLWVCAQSVVADDLLLSTWLRRSLLASALLLLA